MSTVKHFFKFLASIVGGWWSLMSGFASIPLNFFALFSSGTHEKWWFALLGITTLWICIFIMAYKNYPKFKLACSREIAGCAVPNNAKQVRFFRMLVETKCVNGIENCLGHLAKIEKEGAVLFEHDFPELPFAKAEEPDCLAKRILPDNHYWLDILAVYVHQISEEEYRFRLINDPTTWQAHSDRVYFATRPHSPANDINGKYIFSHPGKYDLYINVSGKGAPTAMARLQFNWSGNADTSTIERIE